MIPVGKLCAAVGCSKVAVAKGLCDTHRKRMDRHGHLEPTRASDWGRREKHPLYGYWLSLRRSNGAALGVWYDDFWRFVGDVGERPESSPLLIRIDPDAGWKVGNVMWCESKNGPPQNERHRQHRKKRAEYQREYQRGRRTRDPLYQVATELKRRHGIAFPEYDRIVDAQGPGCAICGREEPRIEVKTGRPYRLSVDHCHRTGELRGLLCSMCNHAIGYLDDSPALLQRAIAYLADPPARALAIPRTGATKKRVRPREPSPYDPPLSSSTE